MGPSLSRPTALIAFIRRLSGHGANRFVALQRGLRGSHSLSYVSGNEIASRGAIRYIGAAGRLVRAFLLLAYTRLLRPKGICQLGGPWRPNQPAQSGHR